MDTIGKVRLVNYKSHKDTTIELSDGLTCLIGSGNVGKSAFMSGIRWVTENYTAKDSISWGESSSAASLFLTPSGIEVTRSRKGKQNTYKIVFADGKEKVFESFGIEVPHEVREVLPLISLPIDIDNTINLNMIRQHDSLFLLGGKWSGSDRNKTINAIIGIQYIDSAIKQIAPEIKGSNSKKEKIEAEIAETKLKIEELGDIEELEKKVNDVKELCKEMESLEKRKEDLTHLMMTAEGIDERLEYIQYRKSKLPSESDIRKFNELMDAYSKLVQVDSTWYEFQERYYKFSVKKHLYDGIDVEAIKAYDEAVTLYAKTLPIFTSAINFQERYDKFLDRKKKYDGVDVEKIAEYFALMEQYKNLLSIEGKADDITKRNADIAERKEYLDMEKDVSYMGLIEKIKEAHTCPFCDSLVDDDKARVIAERI